MRRTSRSAQTDGTPPAPRARRDPAITRGGAMAIARLTNPVAAGVLAAAGERATGGADTARPATGRRRVRHLRQGHRADPAAQLPAVPQPRRRRADVAHDLRGGAALGARDQDSAPAMGPRAGVMPPWFVEKNIGIQRYKGDSSLSEDEIATIAKWADSGAPLRQRRRPAAGQGRADGRRRLAARQARSGREVARGLRAGGGARQVGVDRLGRRPA